MDVQHSNVESTLEILDNIANAAWSVTPGTRAQYPISIRNGTSETHDIEVMIPEPIDWATITPRRMTLRPGGEATVSLALDPSLQQPTAGKHNITVDLRDFEGTRFGQLAGCVDVVPHYQLDIQLIARGPLIRRDLIEGFILHCALVNRGNAETAVQFEGQGGRQLSFKFPTISVPVGGEVAFDIEAHWSPSAITSYPHVVTVRALYPHGNAQAEIGWDAIAESLGPFKPSLHEEEEDFPKIIEWLHADAGATSDTEIARISQTIVPTTAPQSQQAGDQPRTPLRVQLIGSATRAAPSKQSISAWWVLLLAIVAIVVFSLSSRPNGQSVLTPYINFAAATLHHKSGLRPVMERSSNSNSPRAPAVKRSSTTVEVPHPNAAKTQQITASQNIAISMSREVAKGATWDGAVVHVSATNIKVYSTQAHAVRAFIIAGGFKNVFSADGSTTYPLSYVQPGTIVRVFYSYTLGIRHPNAIFIERRR